MTNTIWPQYPGYEERENLLTIMIYSSFHCAFVFLPHYNASTRHVTTPATSNTPTQSSRATCFRTSRGKCLVGSASRGGLGGDELSKQIIAMTETPPLRMLVKQQHCLEQMWVKSKSLGRKTERNIPKWLDWRMRRKLVRRENNYSAKHTNNLGRLSTNWWFVSWMTMFCPPRRNGDGTGRVFKWTLLRDCQLVAFYHNVQTTCVNICQSLLVINIQFWRALT
jgi:hypothetical protein